MLVRTVLYMAPKKQSNNEIFRYLIDKHGLTHKQVAELLSNEYSDVSVKTVSSWSDNRRNIPGTTLKLLTILLDDE